MSATGDMPSSSTGKSPAQQDVILPPGTTLGGFELRKVVGRGGMATVYKGVQLSLNRPVAIKLLAARFARNPSFVQRFEREAGALANLNHPNIVNIIDKGVVEDHYFFVMELVEGITLDQLLHTVELNERHYTHIISEIAKALTYVHSKGIVHRDIKPSNVLVNKQGVVKVSDFGIAHITDAAFPPERFGKKATVGTANYMAPEQADNPARVDVRADVYSLGVTFYKMFTKKLPVGDFKPASLLNSKLPRLVDSVLARAMQRDPTARYATVKEFCDELTQLFVPAGVKSVQEGEPQPFLFNPTFLTGDNSGKTGPDDTSSAISLFVPTNWPSSGDSAGSPMPFQSPFAGKPQDKEVASPVPQSRAKSQRTQLIVAIAALAVILLLLIVFVFRANSG
jgi:serine/threonine-protein kinase